MYMKGIILAGGLGTRLRPITKYLNKHMCPVFNRPMIEYPLDTLKQLGIEDILVVSGREHAGDFLEYLGSGVDYNVKFTYRVQEEAGGIAEALGLASSFADNSSICVILGDNIFDVLSEDSRNIATGKAKVFVKKVHDADRFGVARFGSDGKIETIVEKPKDIKIGFAVTGLYIYPPGVFDVINRLKPSQRGELEITDVNNYYAKLGLLDHEIVEGFWTDAGTPESLARATQWAIKNQKLAL